MLNWIGENASSISAVAATVSACVWIGYLQMMLMQLRRNSRPVILISRSAGQSTDARLFISNMGGEPIYVTSLIADLDLDDQKAYAIITDNNQIADNEDDSDSRATNEGPLGSGEYMDTGRFSTLMMRIDARAIPSIDSSRVKCLTLTVIASSSHSNHFIGAKRSFHVEERDGTPVYHPHTMHTQQLRSPLARRRLRRRLQQNMKDGAF